MKALVVTPYYYPKIGGLEAYAHQLNKALQAEGWDIVVATSNHAHRTTAIETIDTIRIYRLSTWFKFSNTPLNPLWPFAIRRIIRTEKPDLIIAHTPVPSLADATALVAGKTPLVLVYHAATLFKSGSLLFSVVARLYKLYERFTLGRANRIIAVSPYVKEQFPKRLQNKIVVVPNAVNEHDITTRVQPTNAPFLFISSLDKTHAWKGLDLTLAAIAATKDATLQIMGDGNDRTHYESLASSLGIRERVTFLGNLTGERKDAAFKTALALVMYPISPNDALPTVMLEAWARSVPVIAAAIGPIPTLITDRVDGYLVAPNQSDALATSLERISASPSSERMAIAEAARIRVMQEYTWGKQAQRMQAIQKELI